MNLKRIHFHLHTFCRYFLATMILSYAFAKIIGTQFTSQPSIYDQPIGSLSGFNLTWFYYGYSFWYGVFIAASQIASALLLFFRKTTRLGVMLFLTFMVNIVLLDFAYDIEGAKGMATVLVLMAFFIFFSEYPLFIKYFFTEPPLFQNQDRPYWMNKIKLAKWIYIPLAFIGIYFGLSTLKAKYMAPNQFYGTWQNEDTNANLKYFNFEFSNTFKINGNHNIDKIAKGKYSFTEDMITLHTFAKGYQDNLKNSKTDDIMNTDSTKMTTFIQGKYRLNGNQLIIQNDSISLELIKVR